MQLEPVLDLRAAKALHERLRAVRGQALLLDASAVERAGGLCVQVLLAAQEAWRADGERFAIVKPSEPLKDAVRLMGAHDLVLEEYHS